MTSFSTIYHTLAVAGLVLFSTMSYAACDRLHVEMAKEAGDPQGSNACLPHTQSKTSPTQRDLNFLAQLAMTDGGTNPFLQPNGRNAVVTIAELKGEVTKGKTILVVARKNSDDNFFKQLAGLDCIGC